MDFSVFLRLITPVGGSLCETINSSILQDIFSSVLQYINYFEAICSSKRMQENI